MPQTLRNKQLDVTFINSLIQLSEVHNIEDWFLIHENFYAGTDHNGTNSLDCTYILTDQKQENVAIYFAQFDNNLEIAKNIEIVSFINALEGNVVFNKISKNFLSEKIKNFQLSYLNENLSFHLIDKNYNDKKTKI